MQDLALERFGQKSINWDELGASIKKWKGDWSVILNMLCHNVID